MLHSKTPVLCLSTQACVILKMYHYTPSNCNCKPFCETSFNYLTNDTSSLCSVSMTHVCISVATMFPQAEYKHKNTSLAHNFSLIASVLNTKLNIVVYTNIIICHQI